MNDDEIHDLVDEVLGEIVGTCSTLAEVLGDERAHVLDDERFTGLIDEQAFECECCGWWYEIAYVSDLDSDEMICHDCCDMTDDE